MMLRHDFFLHSSAFRWFRGRPTENWAWRRSRIPAEELRFLERFRSPSSPVLRSDLFNGQKSFRQIVSKRGEFREAGRGGFELLLLPDEVVVPVESNSRAEVPVHEVRRFGEHFKSVWDDRG